MPGTAACRELLGRLLDKYERGAAFGRPAPWRQDMIVRLDARQFPEAFAPRAARRSPISARRPRSWPHARPLTSAARGVGKSPRPPPAGFRAPVSPPGPRSGGSVDAWDSRVHRRTARGASRPSPPAPPASPARLSAVSDRLMVTKFSNRTVMVTVRNPRKPSARIRSKTPPASARARSKTKGRSSVSCSNVSCSPTDLRSHSFETGLRDTPRARSCRSWPHLPSHSTSRDGSTARSSAMVRMPRARRNTSVFGPMPGITRIDSGSRKSWTASGTDDRQPVRLPEVRGDLGDELVRREAHRARQSLALQDHGLQGPDMGLRLLEIGERGEIEVGLVDAGLLEGVGPLGDERHDPGRHFLVQRVIAAQEHGGRLASPSGRLGEAPRPRDRQGRPDAVLPGRIAGRGDDSAPLALLRIGADDDRPPAELGIAPLLHRGVERVHVEMGDDPHRGEFTRAALTIVATSCSVPT